MNRKSNNYEIHFNKRFSKVSMRPMWCSTEDTLRKEPFLNLIHPDLLIAALIAILYPAYNGEAKSRPK